MTSLLQRKRRKPIVASVVVLAVAAAALAGWAYLQWAAEPAVGLITKTNTNPFFIKMAEGAESSARIKHLRLLKAAGRSDGDHESQVVALKSMIDAGVRAVLITPNDAKAIVPELQKARDKGVLVIALDSPTDPPQAVDATFGTNNFEAGRLVGGYAKGLMKGREPKIAMLDAFAGHAVGTQRHNGFLVGMGLGTASLATAEAVKSDAVVCTADTYGDREKGREGMARCLREHPEINLVYTLNEPVAAGARLALAAAGRGNVPIVSIDGGCQGVRDVASGSIAATAQQYPLSMATEGVASAAEYIRSGRKPARFIDTQAILITDAPQPGVDSRNTRFGLSACWG